MAGQSTLKATTSIRGYAKRIGVDESSARAAIAAGRLRASISRDASGRIRVDPEQADIEWNANTSPAASRRRTVARAPVNAPPAATASEDGTDYRKSLVLEKTVKTRLAMLRLEVEESRYVPVEEVKRAHYEIARRLRARLLELPDRLSDELAGESSAHRVRAILDREFREFLTDEVLKLADRK
jgi:hypothetical protein